MLFTFVLSFQSTQSMFSNSLNKTVVRPPAPPATMLVPPPNLMSQMPPPPTSCTMPQVGIPPWTPTFQAATLPQSVQPTVLTSQQVCRHPMPYNLKAAVGVLWSMSQL